jgi:tetratricopeptide (TPR) repeat protein
MRLTIVLVLSLWISGSGLFVLPVTAAEMETREQADAALRELEPLILREPKVAGHYIRRGDVYYLLGDMYRAAEDYGHAIKLDARSDEAYFGRGMALARMGLVAEGIADLSVYIERHPNSSVAYTKRGVRNIWRNDLEAAERDLSRAIALDPKNAEAHDDLGVVFAKRNRIRQAAIHFSTAIQLDPGYQKAYHNLAICFHVGGQPEAALETVDAGLKLDKASRSSLMLKSAILKTLGRDKEAAALADQAEFLPEDNWTERTTLHGLAK